MVNAKAIDNALEFLAVNGFYRINAHQVAYIAKEPDVNAVYEYLLKREPEVLKRYFEIMCPNYHSTATYKKLEDIPNRWIECRYCPENAEFIPDPNRVHIVFDFNPDYIAQVKEDYDQKNLERPMIVV